MQDIIKKIENADCQNITETMNQNGYTIIPNLLPDKDCEELKANYDHPTAYRKTVVMARYRFGLGERHTFGIIFQDATS